MTLDEMKRLAAAATAGPWYAAVEFGSLVVRSPDVATRAVAFWLDRTKVTADAAFIAAFNPETAKRLIAVVEAAHATGHGAFAQHDGDCVLCKAVAALSPPGEPVVRETKGGGDE